jgi:hypothetical protein
MAHDLIYCFAQSRQTVVVISTLKLLTTKQPNPSRSFSRNHPHIRCYAACVVDLAALSGEQIIEEQFLTP